MNKITVRPDVELEQLHAKMDRLAKLAQAKKEELRKKQGAKADAAEKAEKESQLKDLFDDGEKFAVWLKTLEPYYYRIDIPGFDGCGFCFLGNRWEEHTVRRDRERLIEKYIVFLRTAFKELHNQFLKKIIYDTGREKKTTTYPKNYSNKLKKDFEPKVAALHAHMAGFIETMLKENPDTDAILCVVKVAMVASADTFHEFGGRQKVLEHLKTTVVDEIEEKLTTGKNLDENGINEMERILEEVQKAVGQQVKG